MIPLGAALETGIIILSYSILYPSTHPLTRLLVQDAWLGGLHTALPTLSTWREPVLLGIRFPARPGPLSVHPSPAGHNRYTAVTGWRVPKL